MATNSDRLFLLGAALAALSGCATDGDTLFAKDTSWGEANRVTMAAQVIDPAPVYDNPIPESSADNAVDAIDRYRADAVKQPERVSTTETPD